MELKEIKNENKKNRFMWILWVIIIILFVGFFPKSCGKNDSNLTIDSKCIGIKGPFINTNNNWCYGICIEKSIKENKTISNITKTNSEASGIISNLTSSFSGLLRPLIIILMIIALVKIIDSIKKRKSNTVIYKKI